MMQACHFEDGPNVVPSWLSSLYERVLASSCIVRLGRAGDRNSVTEVHAQRAPKTETCTVLRICWLVSEWTAALLGHGVGLLQAKGRPKETLLGSIGAAQAWLQKRVVPEVCPK